MPEGPLAPEFLSTAPNDELTVERVWETVEPYLETMEHQPGETIRPRDTGDTSAGIVIERLRQDATEPLVIKGELGRGGMGVVHLATQTTVGRDVAVKSPRDDAAPGSAARLLREGWVTGAVEHPNIVPVYDVSLAPDGTPQVVFRRIGGDDWGRLLEQPDEVRSRFGVADPFDWHIRVLMEVCRAIEYAHGRGIVHRDLKPDNVMIGEYGEVYVVDWGIAVSLRDDQGGRLPMARDANGMAGTPAFMAPEMFAGKVGVIDERTDVYLLGGTLFRLLSGKAPHSGKRPLELVTQALAGPPEMPDKAPSELANLCRRALSPDQSARPATAGEFRQDLQRYLDHRDSERLSTGASLQLKALVRSLDKDEDGYDTRLKRYRLFGECRFGFQQAIRSWRQNEAAHAGLEQAIDIMIDYELSQGNHDSAAALLADLGRTSPYIAERVERAQKDAERRKKREAHKKTYHDPRIGRRDRARAVVALSALWSGTALWRLLTGTPRGDYLIVAAGPTVSAILIVAIAWATRGSWLRTSLNRRLVASAVVAMLAQIVLLMAAWPAAVPINEVAAYQLFTAAVTIGVVAVALAPLLWPSAVVFTLAFALTLQRPDLVEYGFAAGNILLAANAVWIWGPRSSD